jgi:hypothetical protein
MLSKEEIIPKIESKGFVNLNGHIWQCAREGKKYIVDFKNQEVCIAGGDDGLDRLYDVPSDDFLGRMQALCGYVVEPSADDVPEKVKAEIVDQPDEEIFYTPQPIKTVSVVEQTPRNITGIVRPAVTAIEAATAWNEYVEMRSVILDKSDFQHIQGKDFIKKSGWRKFATFYNLTDAIEEEKRIKVDEKEFMWKLKVICTAPNGRQTEGVAIVSSKEKSGARIEHDVYTTAHTRAKNRAISDMIAAGEVSAEEVN